MTEIVEELARAIEASGGVYYPKHTALCILPIITRLLSEAEARGIEKAAKVADDVAVECEEYPSVSERRASARWARHIAATIRSFPLKDSDNGKD